MKRFLLETKNGIFKTSKCPIWPNDSHITLSRGSHETSGIAFSYLKNAEKIRNEGKIPLIRGCNDP